MSLMSVSKPNQLITVEYLVNELINQLVNGGPDKQVILRAYHIINHLEPLSEYFPIETTSNKALVEVGGDSQTYNIYLINNPLLDTDLKGIVNWEELIFMDYLKVKENSELNLNKLNLINFIYNLVQYFGLLKGQKLTEGSQLTKEWQKIYKNKNLRFNLLLNPRRNNSPHTLTLKLNEKLEQIRIQELKEQLKVKSNNVKYLGRSLSASIQSIINYCNYSTQICNLNLSLLSSFSTRLPLKWIDKEFNNSLRILFIKLQNEANFDPESLVPILELWSVWARRIGEVPTEEISAYNAEADQLTKLIEHHLNSNFKKSQKTVELSLMIIVILADIFKSKELLNRSEKIISDGLMAKDSNSKSLLNNSQYIHPTISTLLKHLPLLKNPQQMIQNYLNLQNYEPKIEGNMNTLASLVFILTSLEKEGITSSKLITRSILDPILDSILAYNYDVNKDSNLISPIFALAGAIQVLIQGHNYPSRSYSKKVRQSVNKLTSLELNNTEELTTLDKSISILLSNFKKLHNFEKLGVDIKSINLFLFNYLIKYWEQFTYKSNKDDDGQLLLIKEITNTPTFKELGKQSQLMGELMSWPFQLSNYFSLDKPDLIKLTQLELSKLTEFSQNLFNSWKLGVSEDPSLLNKIRDPSNDSVRKSLKSVLFSYAIIFKSVLARPMTAVQVSNEELELMLTSLFNLNFSTIIQIPRTIFKNQEDLLIYLLEQVESRKTRVKPFIEGLLKEVEVDSEPTELNGLNQLEQSKISFTLTCIEQLVKEVDNNLLENIIEKLIKPFASEKFSWSLELYEASHSAALSIIQSSKAECVPKFISWYQNQLFDHFPGQMTGEQFRVAYTILVEGLSNQLDADVNQVWALYTQLYVKIENCLSKLNTNPELILESIGYINTYAALLPNTPSSYLNEYLAKLEHLIKFFDKHPSITNNTLTALVSLVKRMITENCDLGTKPYLVGWYLNLLNNLNLNKNSSLTSQLQA